MQDKVKWDQHHTPQFVGTPRATFPMPWGFHSSVSCSCRCNLGELIPRDVFAFHQKTNRWSDKITNSHKATASLHCWQRRKHTNSQGTFRDLPSAVFPFWGVSPFLKTLQRLQFQPKVTWLHFLWKTTALPAPPSLVLHSLEQSTQISRKGVRSEANAWIAPRLAAQREQFQQKAFIIFLVLNAFGQDEIC